jgi:hypothetical protein
MVLGSRLLNDFNSGNGVWEAMLRGLAPHVSAVDVHCYDQMPCVELMVNAHEITGLPVLMSEFGFRARDSDLPNTMGAGPLVWTQTQRASAYKDYIEALVKLEFVVGCVNEPSQPQTF